MKIRTMSIPEAADFLGITNTRMRKLVNQGTIPALQGKGARQTVRRSDVLSYASQRGQKITGTAQPIAVDMSTWQGERPNGKPKLIDLLIAQGLAAPCDGPTAEDLELDEQVFCIQNNTEYKPRIIVGLRPTWEDTVIYTDNRGVVEWLARKGIFGTVINEKTLQPHQVQNKHVIAGLLPTYIQVECRSISTIRARGVYIRTASADDLDAAGAELISYLPPRPTDNLWER